MPGRQVRRRLQDRARAARRPRRRSRGRRRHSARRRARLSLAISRFGPAFGREDDSGRPAPGRKFCARRSTILQPVLVEPQVGDDLRVEQADGVGGDRVAEARVELLGDRRAADDAAALDHLHLQPGHAEIGGAGQPVVAGADDHDIVLLRSCAHGLGTTAHQMRGFAATASSDVEIIIAGSCESGLLPYSLGRPPSLTGTVCVAFPLKSCIASRHLEIHVSRAQAIILAQTRPSWRRFRVGRSKTGLGLFALKPIRRGEFIANYTGRLITNNDADELWTKYLFEINNRWTVDGSGRATSRATSTTPASRTPKPTSRGTRSSSPRSGPSIPATRSPTTTARNYFNTFIKPQGCRCLAARTSARKSEPRSGRPPSGANSASPASAPTGTPSFNPCAYDPGTPRSSDRP